MKIISLDCETTGIDFHHGAKPFLVTTCNQGNLTRAWEWPVDPLTRQPDVDPDEVDQIQSLIDGVDIIWFHNAKFDIRALWTIGISVPFDKVRCSLFGSHLLATNHAHDLTSTCIEYLNHDITKWEDRVKAATQACRKAIKSDAFVESGLTTSGWKLAEEGDPDMPSVKSSSKRGEDKPWKNDMWLPRAMAAALLDRSVVEQLSGADLIALDRAGFEIEWLNACRQYANVDSSVTLPLGLWMTKEIERRGLTAIYMERLKLVRIAAELEENRVTASRRETERLIAEYSEHVDLCQAECMTIAEQLEFDLELPAGASPNDSIREFMWGSVRLICPRCGLEKLHKEWEAGPVECLNGQLTCPKCLKRKARPGPATVTRQIKRNPCLALPKIISGKTGNPTLDKDALERYRQILEPGPGLEFINHLTGMRSQQTAVTYMRSYGRFWLPVEEGSDWCRLAPSVNPTGTDHLRWASYNPNSQNISKKENFNLRRCFGPMPGREWWSMDGKNLELRIPAFEAGEEDLMWVFNHPDDPPYYGSYHLVVFDVLHPKLFAEHGKAVKDLFESTWYQWTKNGNFAIIYGCQRRKADETYHVPGAYDLIGKRFPKIAALAARQIELAKKRGYVETIPDRTVDPTRGYPILASRTEDGYVLPTTPLNYHVSGTAMQWTNKAMVRTSERIWEWNRRGWDGFITLQVHDELVFDCPAGTGPEPWRTNLPKMKELAALMEAGGSDISVPTPVSIEYHDVNWSKGLAI